MRWLVRLGLAALVLGALAWLGVRGFTVWYPRAALDPAFFADEIAAFAEADAAAPPREGGIVFVGSSSIRLWKTLAEDMAPLPVLNRGFGGSQTNSVVHYVDETVLRYRPRGVVLYVGGNDLAPSTGKTAADVAAGFDAFVARVHAKLPETRIYYLSIKPTRLGWDRFPEQAKANAAIAARCAGDPRLAYLDVATPMLATGEPPARRLFVLDGMHPSAEGYALMTSVVKPRLLADFHNASP